MVHVGYSAFLCEQYLYEVEHSEIRLIYCCGMRSSYWNLYKNPRDWSLILKRNPIEIDYLIWLILPVVIRLS